MHNVENFDLLIFSIIIIKYIYIYIFLRVLKNNAYTVSIIMNSCESVPIINVIKDIRNLF